MAANMPFIPVSMSIGGMVTVVSSATNVSIPSTITSKYAPSLMVINRGANVAWIRMTAEAVPVATGSDVLMMPNTVQLFANPNPIGTTGVAIIVSVTTSPNTVYFVPGQGGM